ncbi:MAG TPA: glutamate-1-semialdehyde 2,1-aminomutase [Planctomycetota bacterium]|nr:glutamate-1-semialdehyde 2,1-aminomutase [Planctomycetota bacterium]
MNPIVHSEALLRRAEALVPGGVNSPVRAYRSVGGVPRFVARADGPFVWDEDDNRYVDLVMSFGPHLLGHGAPAIRQALHDQVDVGLCFGAPTRGEVELAEEIRDAVPAIEMVRLVNSGTEATMAAVRLARAATGRTRLVKFDGNYHGHGDAFLVKAGSGALTHGAPDSPGVPADAARLTLVADYNRLETVEALFAAHGADVAAIIVEPVCGNVGLLRPAKGFLEGLRALCDRHGALLIFDEVMTGFRVARGGYQELCGVRPDLVCLGKVIGGGLPVGAYGGRRDLMSQIAPAGAVYQAGTLSGNPMTVQAGLAMLRALRDRSVYDRLEDAGAHLESGLDHICRSLGVPAVVQRQGSMLCLYFSPKPCVTLADVMASDRARFRAFFHGMLERGVLLPPSPFEAWFLSTAHDAAALDLVLDAARESLRPAS